MHPPGKRSISISDWKNTMQNRVDTRGPASAALTSTIGKNTRQSQTVTRGPAQRPHPKNGLFTATDRSNKR